MAVSHDMSSSVSTSSTSEVPLFDASWLAEEIAGLRASFSCEKFSHEETLIAVSRVTPLAVLKDQES